jgi:upstream-binding transcription factor
MATAAAGSKRVGGRGRKALVAVLDNDANISAGKAAAQTGDLSASSAPKAKRASARSGKAAKAAAAAAAASVVDDVAELQGMLERLRLEKEKAEEMVRERDEVIRKKEEEIETKEKEQERLQAELRKVQRAKEFKPTVVRSQISRF